MKLTTKGRYAVTAMLDLALHFDKGPVTLADISKRQGISLSYLEQLFAKLRKNKLVKSVRGPGGGYLLGRSSHEIDVAEVINSVSEAQTADKDAEKSEVKETEHCLSHQLWCDLSDQIHQFLKGITLANVVSKRESAGNDLTIGSERQEQRYTEQSNLHRNNAILSN